MVGAFGGFWKGSSRGPSPGVTSTGTHRQCRSAASLAAERARLVSPCDRDGVAAYMRSCARAGTSRSPRTSPAPPSPRSRPYCATRPKGSPPPASPNGLASATASPAATSSSSPTPGPWTLPSATARRAAPNPSTAGRHLGCDYRVIASPGRGGPTGRVATGTPTLPELGAAATVSGSKPLAPDVSCRGSTVEAPTDHPTLQRPQPVSRSADNVRPGTSRGHPPATKALAAPRASLSRPSRIASAGESSSSCGFMPMNQARIT